MDIFLKLITDPLIIFTGIPAICLLIYFMYTNIIKGSF
jgi:hypothetical protein